jgi:SAM-dependent methyltransferase
LSLAWGRRARKVTGVDISPAMIEKGREFVRNALNVDLRVNDASDLRSFEDGRFDLVFSHICLQHIPWHLTRCYLEEFARVCRPGGWVAFQLPARPLRSFTLAAARKWIMDLLPFGLDRLYRNWKHGCPVLFEMHYTPPETVLGVTSPAGLIEVHREPDASAGISIQSFIYVFRKK